ncbi:RAMP2 protein, partial [Catharus fuscescens]|nr:RAMP2 protein [Catharus fuscescens]
MAPRAHMSSRRLSQGLLLLWVLLGHTQTVHTDAVNTSLSQDAGTSQPTAMSNGTAQPIDGIYTNLTLGCWAYFVDLMRDVRTSDLCEWKIIIRPYSELRGCLEYWAERLNYSYPNALAEQYIFQSHDHYFHNCTLEHPVYLDPPEDVLLAMIIAPICLIPFLVTLVIWRSKDSKAQ